MLHTENRQYTVKRSELRFNGGVLIYSLISSPLLGTLPHPSLIIPFHPPSEHTVIFSRATFSCFLVWFELQRHPAIGTGSIGGKTTWSQ